ncbi:MULTISPECIES: lipid-A-disaccharide synthase [unclassified Leptolyngbya]|uniref:lipid-A-disaccharide synthase n=1 Tax=unclassified Leptolyngbya TaxID=2650499 RepID=UPI001686E3E3|nr:MULTISPECIES: lipid-A-disaccharide synthase [unclassified Leptolyngbya]MBD1912528.1 lipid-A-disaccharide synthase [Leptolyngbya sp. FACHB-8]MBD2156461.1 lipid-A-disaccharide synthase [Leptolyngbya sp. FACHB-16]
MPSSPIDILILSNGPGEVTTWVRPVVKALRESLGNDRALFRISLVLSPCPNGTGKEVAIAQTYPEIDRVQGAEHFFPFLLWGKTAEGWEWGDRGIVLFLGGDQIYPVIIGKRLGYRTLIYAEWEARWLRWVDRFAVMSPTVKERCAAEFQDKVAVVGDLMAEAGAHAGAAPPPDGRQIGLLPGSKAAKLTQGVPLMLAIARHLRQADPTLRFVLPVAPTLDLPTLAQFADPEQNPIAHYFGGLRATLVEGEPPSLMTEDGLKIALHQEFPAYDLFRQCQLCLTSVGANTAELGSLGVPMIVLLPTQQLDAMRAWDGIPGLLANLPGMGSLFARVINGWFLRKKRLLAWPNIWAGEEIVPERIGELDPATLAKDVLDLLEHPDMLQGMRDRLHKARGASGAARKIADIVESMLIELV